MFKIIKIVDASIFRSTLRLNRCLKCYCTTTSKISLPLQEVQLTKNESDIDDRLFEMVSNVKERLDLNHLLKPASKVVIQRDQSLIQILDSLASWCKEENVSIERIKAHDYYKNLMSKVNSIGHTQDIHTIIKTISILKSIGLSENESEIKLLTTSLHWNIERIDVSALLKLLEYKLVEQKESSTDAVVAQIISEIGHKWKEITSGYDFACVYKLGHLFEGNVLSYIDDRVIELVANFKLSELINIYCSLAVSHRRSKPVLRSLSYFMFRSEDMMSPKQIVNTVTAMNKINYPDQALLYKFSKDFICQIDDVKNANIVGSLVFASGLLRWRDPELLTCLANWMMKNEQICQRKHFKYLLLTMAYVSYTPTDVSGLFETIISKLNDSKSDNPNFWIEIVWSLVVLGKATNSHLESILDEQFVNNIASDDPTNVGVHFKILNINAAAKHLYDDYNGPTLGSVAVDNLIVTSNRKDRSTKVYVIKVLENLCPPPKYLRTNLLISSGFVVDAEFILDHRRNPVEVEKYSSNFGSKESAKILPSDAHKIAMLVLNFKDYTIGSQELTGDNRLAIQILNKLGYGVLQIPYYDINENLKIVHRVQYLERKIKELLDV